MLDKYKQNFAQLDETQTSHILGFLAPIIPEEHRHMEGLSGASLFDMCEVSGLDQATVVMCMAHDPSAVGVTCLEVLVGKPIVRRVEKIARTVRNTGPRVRVTKPLLDPRVITSVKPNPKKVGSASHERYEKYKEGMTVQDFIAAGGKTADIKWDVSKGFIVLGDAP